MTTTRSLIDTPRRRAGAMARPFIDAGHQPDATEMERAFGEAAQLILCDAESPAKMLPRVALERRVETFKAWHRGREAEFHQWVDGYALTAWIRATEDLLTLDRPSALVSTQESPARHWSGREISRNIGRARAFYSDGDCL
jgi:hypothetical protein